MIVFIRLAVLCVGGNCDSEILRKPSKPDANSQVFDKLQRFRLYISSKLKKMQTAFHGNYVELRIEKENERDDNRSDLLMNNFSMPMRHPLVRIFLAGLQPNKDRENNT
jgi:hypothetical protein